MPWLTGKWQVCLLIERPDADPWHKRCRDEAGVYRLIGLDQYRPKIIVAPISRIFGIDRTGTLNIGATDSLHGRIGSLVRTHDPKFAGGQHRKLPERMRKRFPPNKLAVAWQYTKRPYEREEKLLCDYENEFGEMPPLYRQ